MDEWPADVYHFFQRSLERSCQQEHAGSTKAERKKERNDLNHTSLSYTLLLPSYALVPHYQQSVSHNIKPCSKSLCHDPSQLLRSAWPGHLTTLEKWHVKIRPSAPPKLCLDRFKRATKHSRLRLYLQPFGAASADDFVNCNPHNSEAFSHISKKKKCIGQHVWPFLQLHLMSDSERSPPLETEDRTHFSYFMHKDLGGIQCVHEGSNATDPQLKTGIKLEARNEIAR